MILSHVEQNTTKLCEKKQHTHTRNQPGPAGGIHGGRRCMQTICALTLTRSICSQKFRGANDDDSRLRQQLRALANRGPISLGPCLVPSSKLETARYRYVYIYVISYSEYLWFRLEAYGPRYSLHACADGQTDGCDIVYHRSVVRSSWHRYHFTVSLVFGEF